MRSLLLLAVVAFSNPVVVARNTIAGRLPAHVNNDVIIYRYDDYVSYKKTVVTVAHTDAQGNFSVQVDHANEQLHIEAANNSIDFFVLRGGLYTIGMKGYHMHVKEEHVVAVNDILRRANGFLVKEWYPSYINIENGDFRSDYDPDSVLNAWTKCRSTIMEGISDPFVVSLIDYQLARAKCSFLQILPEKMGDRQANQLMDQFEKEYFHDRAVGYNNPYYLNTLFVYMHGRLLTISFKRSGPASDDNTMNRLKSECRYFKDSLQQLAIVHGIKELYKNKFHGEKAAATEADIRRYEDSIRYPFARHIYRNVVATYNSINPGDQFPVMTLPNEKGKPVAIKNINSDVILVDFWATWCLPCKQHMAQFPRLMKTYGKKLVIVSISVDDSLQTMKRFLDQQKYTGKWITLHNGNGGNYYNKLRIDGYPSYFILDKNKKILAMPFFNNMEDELEAIMAGIN